MKKVSITGLIGVILLIAPTIAPSQAMANTLTSSSPASGAVLASAPNAVSVTGTSALTDQGTTLSVTDPSGLRVDDGSITVSDSTAVIGLKPLIAAGVYTVTYTLISTSDAPLTGSYTFLFNAPAALASPSATPVATTTAPVTNKSTHTADIFVIILMVFAIFVGLFLIWYARMLLRERQADKRKARSRKKTPATKKAEKE
jgi:methionine-rich copper-binding protein CopC